MFFILARVWVCFLRTRHAVSLRGGCAHALEGVFFFGGAYCILVGVFFWPILELSLRYLEWVIIPSNDFLMNSLFDRCIFMLLRIMWKNGCILWRIMWKIGVKLRRIMWNRIKKSCFVWMRNSFFIVNILIKFVLYLVLELVYVFLLLIPKGIIHK